MRAKRFPFILLFLLAACTPAVPMDQVQRDLYSDQQSSRATGEALLSLAQYQADALTATSVAPLIRITETAAAQSVQQTQAAAAMAMQQQYWTVTAQSIQETQTSAMTQTAMSWTATPNATSTAAFAMLNAESTQMANNIERDKLELERQRDINDFKGKLPAYSFVIVVLVLVIFLMLIMRTRRYQPAQVDARGNVLPLLDLVEGTFTDIDRSPNHRGDLHDNLFKQWLRKKLELPLLLPAVTAERQDATTERDQMTDLATRGLPEITSGVKERKQLATQQVMKQISDTNLASRFCILDPTRSDLGSIDGEVTKVLDGEWKEAKSK